MGRLFSNYKVTIAVVVAFVIALISVAGGALGAAFGGGFLGSPLGEVSLPAETVADIGGFPLRNSTIMFWAAGLILILLAWLTGRKINDVPGRLQGLFEVVFEFFIEMAEGTAGKAGRQFVAVATLIFLIVLCTNWLGVLPGVGTIGRVESVQAFVEHHAEDEASTVRDEHPGLSSEQAELIAKLEVVMSSGTTFPVFNGGGVPLLPFGRGQSGRAPIGAIVTVDRGDVEAIITEIEEQGTEPEALPAGLRQTLAQIDAQLESSTVNATFEDADGDTHDLVGQKAGLLVPYLRGGSTDVNTTLSVALFAMIAVQFFGFRALGFKGYSGKFLILKQGPIMFVVGALEAFGEITKVISFTFRLFGNMFAGEVLLAAMGFLFPLIGIIPFMGLELFVGVIQAFIFGALTLVFAASAIISHDDHDSHEGAESHAAH